MISFDIPKRIARGMLAAILAAALAPAIARANSDAPRDTRATPHPIASASADAPSDPCGGPGMLLATLDRPTVGYSACALPKGAIVLEEGYQIQNQAGPGASVIASFPQGFERVGITDRLELDLIGPAYNRSRVGATIATGYNDLGLGFKYELPQNGRFTYAIDGFFQAATGTGGFGAGGPTSAVDLDIAFAASPTIGIATTLAAYSAPGTTASGTTPTGEATGGITSRYGYFLPSIVVTAQTPNDYQFYAELVGRTKSAPDRGGQVLTDFGVQKLLGPNLEIDGEYGIGFTPIDGSRFRYVGLGVGVRVK